MVERSDFPASAGERATETPEATAGRFFQVDEERGVSRTKHDAVIEGIRARDRHIVDTIVHLGITEGEPAADILELLVKELADAPALVAPAEVSHG